MKRLLPLVCCAGCLAALLPSTWAQVSADTAAAIADRQADEERYKRLNSAVDDLVAAQAVMAKRINALEDELKGLRDDLARAHTNRYVSRSEFDDLVRKLKELDDQRIKDRDLILQRIQDLAKVAAAPPPAPAPAPAPTDSTPQSELHGYKYKVQRGDTLAAIVAAYRAKGVKVTLEGVEKANPKLKPRELKVGQVVFIPDPSLH
jgi:septal ring factor EnvC (AmiA/AmiB activator)